jgi:uncharacterized protein (DUF433 family)
MAGRGHHASDRFESKRWQTVEKSSSAAGDPQRTRRRGSSTLWRDVWRLRSAYTSPVTAARFDRITVDPDVLGGRPCIRGLRMSVGMVVQMVASGKTSQQIVEEYPYLEVADVQQALAYSAALAESEYHLVLRPSA